MEVSEIHEVGFAIVGFNLRRILQTLGKPSEHFGTELLYVRENGQEPLLWGGNKCSAVGNKIGARIAELPAFVPGIVFDSQALCLDGRVWFSFLREDSHTRYAFTPNDVRERRGPAATDVRIVSELNGWSSSAPRNSSAFSRSLGVPAGCKTAGNE